MKIARINLGRGYYQETIDRYIIVEGLPNLVGAFSQTKIGLNHAVHNIIYKIKMSYDYLDELENNEGFSQNIVLFSSVGKELAQTFDLS